MLAINSLKTMSNITALALLVLASQGASAQAVYRIVGPDELDLKLGLISIDSPLARALIGKALDAEVRVQTPTGEQLVYIVAIEYP